MDCALAWVPPQVDCLQSTDNLLEENSLIPSKLMPTTYTSQMQLLHPLESSR